MIITRTPFRASFLGGGTDLPWFYEEYGGSVISSALDKHMYLSAHPLFDSDKILLKYSKTEFVDKAVHLAHPIGREVLDHFQASGLDISVSADIPAGTGLGSSSAFTVGLIKLITTLQKKEMSTYDLAEFACQIEIDRLGEKIGKQDQFASAFGGLNHIVFRQDGQVNVHPIHLSSDSEKWLSSSLILVRVGAATRSASEQLKSIQSDSHSDKSRIQALLDLRDLANDSVPSIKKDPSSIADYINLAWKMKIASNPASTNSEIDNLIEFGRRNGATGAKLLGAGGSGFVLFVVHPERMEKFIDAIGPRSVLRIRPDFMGSTVIYST